MYERALKIDPKNISLQKKAGRFDRQKNKIKNFHSRKLSVKSFFLCKKWLSFFSESNIFTSVRGAVPAVVSRRLFCRLT